MAAACAEHREVLSESTSAELWHSPTFEPTLRDGRLYCRGACDDKGNFLPLLHVACAMAGAGELPVNVRVLVEGEEEMGGGAVTEWVCQDARGADAAIVFDSGIPDPRTPAITVGLRGVVMIGLTVRTAERNLHSGLYGGSVLNALHVLGGVQDPEHMHEVRDPHQGLPVSLEVEETVHEVVAPAPRWADV